MRKTHLMLCALAAQVVLFAGSANAATIVSVDFDTSPPDTTPAYDFDSSNDVATPSGLTFTTTAVSGDQNFATSANAKISTGAPYTFELDIDSGVTLNLTEISFDARGGHTGNAPTYGTSRSVTLNFTEEGESPIALLTTTGMLRRDGPSGTGDGFQTYTFDLTGAAYQGLTAQQIQFSIENAVGTTNEIDNVVLTGTVTAIPEPSFTALLGLCGLFTLLRRRR